MHARVLLAACVTLAISPCFARAGDYHNGASLVCSDCHVAHASQQHGYAVGGAFGPIGAAAPYANLLRNDENALCLSCHDGSSTAPDVFGIGSGAPAVRQAGGLNAAAGNPAGLANDPGYDEIDGHTLWSKAMPPHAGAATPYVPSAIGLRCIDCHAQHGTTNWRNLLNRGAFAGDTLSYAAGVNDLTKDVYERTVADYAAGDIAFNEPNVHDSRYARWCNACHVDFHGRGSDANMGGAPGGVGASNATPWRRHPTADVNIGESGPSATFISSLAQWSSHAQRVQVMDSQGLWTGTGTDNTLTPSCMSCHKAHGNRNAFGLIFVQGSGSPTDDGDGGTYVDLCRQCHVEGASSTGGGTASVPWSPPPPPQHQ